MTLTWQSTAAYGVRLLSGRAQIAALSKDNPEHGTARAFIYELLKMTGIGREIESRAISGARKEIESGPMVAGADGQYHVLTGTDSAMALRGARTYHQANTPTVDFASRTPFPVTPGVPGAAA